MDKRERGINFENNELNLLVHLVEKRRNVIENRRSDSVTWKVKDEGWKKIEREFNSLAAGRSFRSSKTLKTKYEGLKRTVRKKCKALHREKYNTGGGQNVAPPLSPLEEKVKELIKISVDGLPSSFDCDIPSEDIAGEGIDGSDTSDAFILSSLEPHIELETDVITELSPRRQESSVELERPELTLSATGSVRDWNKNALRRCKNPALTDRRSNFEALTEKKFEVIEMQKKLLAAEMAGKEEDRLHRQEEHEEKKKEWAFNEKMRQLIEEEQILKIKMLNESLKNE